MDWIKNNWIHWIKDNWILVGVVVLVAFVFWSGLGRRKKKAPGEAIQVNAKCQKCGWQGSVSRYNMVCRKCAGRSMVIF